MKWCRKNEELELLSYLIAVFVPAIWSRVEAIGARLPRSRARLHRWGGGAGARSGFGFGWTTRGEARGPNLQLTKYNRSGISSPAAGMNPASQPASQPGRRAHANAASRLPLVALIKKERTNNNKERSSSVIEITTDQTENHKDFKGFSDIFW